MPESYGKIHRLELSSKNIRFRDYFCFYFSPPSEVVFILSCGNPPESLCMYVGALAHTGDTRSLQVEDDSRPGMELAVINSGIICLRKLHGCF